MVQTKDHSKHNQKKEKTKEIGICTNFKEIGEKITEKMSNVSTNDYDIKVANNKMQEDDQSERKVEIEPKGMEEGFDVTYEEQPYNVIKILVTSRTCIEDEEENEDDTIATSLTKVENLVGKLMKKTWLKW